MAALSTRLFHQPVPAPLIHYSQSPSYDRKRQEAELPAAARAHPVGHHSLASQRPTGLALKYASRGREIIHDDKPEYNQKPQLSSSHPMVRTHRFYVSTRIMH